MEEEFDQLAAALDAALEQRDEETPHVDCTGNTTRNFWREVRDVQDILTTYEGEETGTPLMLGREKEFIRASPLVVKQQAKHYGPEVLQTAMLRFLLKCDKRNEDIIAGTPDFDEEDSVSEAGASGSTPSASGVGGGGTRHCRCPC